MARKPSRKALGRGLSALLTDTSATKSHPDSLQRDSEGSKIPIDLIDSNPNQPRRTFHEDDLEELVQSLRNYGVLQPVLLRPSPKQTGRYQIVAGERRWRAAQRAGIHEVPAVVRELDDQQLLEFAIIENVQRVDLDPIEEARGYAQLIDSFGHTQQQLAETIGKSRSHLTNIMRLLTLPEMVQKMVVDGQLTAGHARALITAKNPTALAREAVTKGMSVRQVETLAKQDGKAAKGSQSTSGAKDADTRLLEGDLSAAIGMRVKIDTSGPDGSGQLKIQFKTLDDLDRLCRKLTE